MICGSTCWFFNSRRRNRRAAPVSRRFCTILSITSPLSSTARQIHMRSPANVEIISPRYQRGDGGLFDDGFGWDLWTELQGPISDRLVRPSTSSPINRSAAKPLISRRKSASGLFSRSVRSAIVSSVIGESSVQVAGVATQPYRRFPMTTQRKGRRALTLAVRAPPLAKLLHHVQGHDPGRTITPASPGVLAARVRPTSSRNHTRRSDHLDVGRCDFPGP